MISRYADLATRWDAAMMPNYGTPPLALQRGAGATVWDYDGRTYLDLVAGIAVSALGHAHPAVVDAVCRQVATLAHTSNLYLHEPGIALAERLLALLGRDGRVFFANSGAEANEAAYKLVLATRPDRRHIVAAEGSFHGRTLGALALTGKAAIREPFAPLGPQVAFVPYGDLAALQAAVTPRTAAFFCEPALGEGGVVLPPPGYLAGVRAACDRAGALLVLDEVQSGIGRTGSWFAHQRDGVVPDVVTLAKGLGGGLPIGACIGLGEAGRAFAKGAHGATFGGNPVAAAAALAVLDTIETEKLLGHVSEVGARWRAGLARVDHPRLHAVRGIGLWLGLVLADARAAQVEAAARAAGFLVNAVQPAVVRLAPPLILTMAQADAFTAALPDLLDLGTVAA